MKRKEILDALSKIERNYTINSNARTYLRDKKYIGIVQYPDGSAGYEITEKGEFYRTSWWNRYVRNGIVIKHTKEIIIFVSGILTNLVVTKIFEKFFGH